MRRTHKLLLSLFSAVALVAGFLTTAGPASAAGVETLRSCSNDSSISWRVCVTMHYSVYQKPGYGPSYAVHKYTYKYTRLEDSQLTSVINAWAKVSVNGPCHYACGGTSWVGKTVDITIGDGSPTSGVVYTYTPSWAGKYILTSSNTWQGSNARAKVKRYSSTWAFNSNSVAFGSVDGW